MAQGHCSYVELRYAARALHLPPRFSTGHRDTHGQRTRRRFRPRELVGKTKIDRPFYPRNRWYDGNDLGTPVCYRVTNHATNSRVERTKPTILCVVIRQTHYIYYLPFLFTAPKYCIMLTLLSRGFPTSPAICGFENFIFDVEVSDVEKRRCTISRS